MMKFVPALLLFLPLLLPAQDEPDAPPPPRPVGVKITRPGVNGIAGTPPVGGTLFTYGYSWEQPAAGDSLHGITTFYEHTVQNHISLVLNTTEPLHRDGKFALGDTCPGIKFRTGDETRWRPILAVTYYVKVPFAPAGFGTGRYDHKVNLAADKGIGKTRFTTNFNTTFAAQKDGTFIRQYMPSLSAITRWRPRWGTVLQSYWTTAGKGYGGFVAAPFVQVNRSFNVFAGGLRNVGPCSTRYGLIAGFNYMLRPRPR
jgi:hypothetical protein